MKKSLLTYSTVDGQTELICRKIAGYYNVEDIDILPISPSINLNNYKAVVIGASIRYGKYRNEIYDFIESNLDSLNKLDNAFFSVNVVARKPEKSTPKTNPYVIKFLNCLLYTSPSPRD